MSVPAVAMPQEQAVRACSTDDVPPGEGRALTVGTRRLAIFNTARGWYALDDACPHRGGPLSDGILADRCVTCPLHERRFDVETGAALSGGEAVRSHEVLVRGQDVYVRIRWL